MRSAHLPRHVFAAAIANDLVLFDSSGDRYLALPGALCDRAQGAVDVGLDGPMIAPEAADMLLGAGLLATDGESHWPTRPMARPDRALAPAWEKGARLPDVIRVATAVLQARRRMRDGLPCRAFHPTRQHPPFLSVAELQKATGRLRAARLLVPHPRRCLPASIVAAIFLRKLGQEVEIVFGVRSHPFEAHCWIEADRIVLDDDLDKVRSFTPIAVGLL